MGDSLRPNQDRPEVIALANQLLEMGGYQGSPSDAYTDAEDLLEFVKERLEGRKQ